MNSPLGWLTTLITMNSFGKLVRSKRFMAPDGRFCSSRDESVKYMVKEGLYEDEEITMMEAGVRRKLHSLWFTSNDELLEFSLIKTLTK